jgi:DNA-binding MarR family transcriptional regulator
MERNCQWRYTLNSDPNDSSAATLLLIEFVPFRLNRLADAVSQNLSEIYRHRFGLEIPEWRVLVTVGQCGLSTAQHIAASTRMHKTRVSRAVASLEGRNLIERAASSSDGRELPLRLTKAGKRVYLALVPLALERERQLLSCLESTERRSFFVGLRRLEESLGLNADQC